MKKSDIIGVAVQGVLSIPVKMIDPVQRNVVAQGSPGRVVAYNKNLISPDKVPNTWVGFLRLEPEGRRFMAGLLWLEKAH